MTSVWCVSLGLAIVFGGCPFRSDDGNFPPPTSEGAVEFMEESALLRNRVDGAGISELTLSDPDCPPNKIKLLDGPVIQIDPLSEPYRRGSGSRLFLSTSPPVQYIVKFISSVNMDTIKTLADEYALLKVLNGKGFSPTLYEIDPNGMDAACYVRVLVSENVGTHELKTLRNFLPVDERTRILYGVAARALEILREIHNRGLIHGDIHWTNMVFSGTPQDAPTTLRLVDFGRASPYLMGSNGHIPKTKIQYGDEWKEFYLSPWELDRSPKTRRDDIFRLAETLLRTGGFDDQFQEQVDSLCQSVQEPTAFYLAKKKRLFSDDTPSLLRDFYTYAVTLRHSERPKYETWMNKFRNALQEES
jgi:serine/threonine protein kinase